MPLDLQYDLVNYTPADATPVEANFNRTQQYVNTELVNRSGSVAMTAQLQLVGDPVNALDAAPKQYVDSFVPIASILMYGGASAPAGGKWALCNGAELEQAAYPILYSRMGQTYGGTAGHFNLPNLSGRFPMGGGTDALGSSGGVRDAVIAPHTHSVDHTHASASTGQDSVGHVHAGVDHVHGVNINTGGFSENHFHMNQFGTYIRYNPGAPQFYIAVTGGGGFDIAGELVDSASISTNWAVQNHYHNVNGATGGADRSLTTAGANTNHTHTFQPPTFSGNSGAASGAAASATNGNLPPYQVVNYIIRIA